MIILTPFMPEYKLAMERFGSEHEVVLLGIGPRNPIRKLLRLGIDLKAQMMLFGFAGSNLLVPGTEVFVTKSYIHQFYGSFDDCPDFLKRPEINGAPELGVPCFSSSDFVVKTKMTDPAIFDMELGFLTTFCPNLSSWRIVSDNLNLQQFEHFIDERDSLNRIDLVGETD